MSNSEVRVDEKDVGYPDGQNIACVRPESVDDVNAFMQYIRDNCDLDELEDEDETSK